jgi:hypothetical protein
LFEQVLQMALEVGAVKVGRVSLDGNEVKANASKHKAMSYGRMEEKQQQLKEEVKRLLEQAEAADEEEDRRTWQPAGRRVAGRVAAAGNATGRIKLAKKVVEQRAREKAAAEGRAHGGQAGQAGRQGSIQLHRSGVAHYEGRRRVCAGLQHADCGGTGLWGRG